MYLYNGQLCNKGGLTLVSKEYCDFTDNMMSKIRSYATFESLGKNGNELLIVIDKRIEDVLQLQNQFIECENNINIANEIMLKFYIQIGRKFYIQDLKHCLNNTLNQILVIMQRMDQMFLTELH